MPPPAGRRHRSSTAASTSTANATVTTELQPLIKSLHDISSKAKDRLSHTALDESTQTLHRIRRLLIDTNPPQQAKDAFRHLYGFQAVLGLLRSISGYYTPDAFKIDRSSFFDLLRALFGLLSDALRDHLGNRRYFAKRVEGGGWTALEQTLASTGLVGVMSSRDGRDDEGADQLFGCLFAFMLAEESLVSMLTGVRRRLTRQVEDLRAQNKASLTTEETIDIIRRNCQSSVGEKELLRNPQIVPIVFNLWLSLHRPQATDQSSVDSTSSSVISTLVHLARSSKYNLLAIHRTGVLSMILRRTFDGSMDETDGALLRSLAETLVVLGLPNLTDAKRLYRTAIATPSAADFLLQALRSSKGPPYIQFDLSLHGYTSVELPTLGRVFPPLSPNPGYTISTWIHIDHFDPKSHTTIFGAFDASQTCFVLAYIEKDTHNFILQTSVTSSRPSVRFKSMSFREHRWYHIAVVHHRPRTMASSKAALFVDGEFVEQVKCQYPARPPSSQQGADQFPSLSANASQRPVQAFLGTPQDLASLLGKGVVSSRWSLASFHLFEATLSDDLIAVYFRLGPRYHGNFQDCLGSFQTYEASALLNMRNEFLHPGKEDKSDIVSAVRLKASGVLHESRVLLNISPAAVFDGDTRSRRNATKLLNFLSKPAEDNLHRYTQSGANAVAINCAIPSINEALMKPHGVAVMTGEPIVMVPSPLDDASWQLCGCAAVGLRMVEAANTREEVVRAVEILMDGVKDNWRNSEAMERQNAFAVLGSLLRSKMGVGSLTAVSNSTGEIRAIDGGVEEQQKLSFELLSLVLGFVGYNHDRPEESIIINPLAYRILLIDFDMWRRTAPVTQRQYYKQFVVFGVKSKYRQYNSKRLFRMRIVRRLLDALKSESFSRDTFPDFMAAFKTLVECNMSAEVLRSLALFVTYALHGPRPPSIRSVASNLHLALGRRRQTTSSSSANGVSTPPLPASHHNGTVGLSRPQLGLEVLEMFTDLLCGDVTTTAMKKFARTVTNKWLLYLLAEEEPRVVSLGMTILSRLLVVHGETYIRKFGSKSGGFIIMRLHLQKWWHISALWPLLLAILFDHDITSIELKTPLKLSFLLETYAPKGEAKAVYPDVLPVITAMLAKGLQVVSHQQDVLNSSVNDSSDNDSGTQTPVRSKSAVNGRRQNSSDPKTTPPDHLDLSDEKLEEHASNLRTVAQFFAKLHATSSNFREFSISSNYVQEILSILFPVIANTESVGAETELEARGPKLIGDGSDIAVTSDTEPPKQAPPILRTTTVEMPVVHKAQRTRPLRRGSSFVLVTSDLARFNPSQAKLNPVLSPSVKTRLPRMPLRVSNSLVRDLEDLIVGVFLDQVLERKEFPGFGLFLKAPPGLPEQQVCFESYVLRTMLSRLAQKLHSDLKILWSPSVLTNMARFVSHLGEALFEGWFIDGAEPLLDFAGTILEYVQRSDIAKIKSIRLCSQAIAATRTVFLRVVLLRLSDSDDSTTSENPTVAFLERLTYWQTVVLSPENTEGDFLRLICYLLYTKLLDSHDQVRLAAANLWRMILVQKPEETASILDQAVRPAQKQLSSGFKKLMELDNETFISWIDDHRDDLDSFFFGSMASTWETFVSQENSKTQETAKSRVAKRRERLKKLVVEETANEETVRRHEVATRHWNVNIHASEHVKHQRALQDQQDTLTYIASTLVKLDCDLKRPCGLLDEGKSPNWRLDQTEGRNRMRLRLLPDGRFDEHTYISKRKHQDSVSRQYKSESPRSSSPVNELVTPSSTPSVTSAPKAFEKGVATIDVVGPDEPVAADEEFEMVDDPHDDGGGFEDKNRKVMRSLQRGDQVQHVYNVSRIVGLEACEGLLILGKESLYLLDNFFQRSDGEIVNVWQAPREERDAYLQMIAGREAPKGKPPSAKGERDARDWRWDDVISISKRRFLFRDVAIEVFFTDGQSYLLTALTPTFRNELYQKLIGKAPHVVGNSASPHPEDAWRLDALRSHSDTPQSLGTKFVSVFNTPTSLPATRRWLKGEISNFHYLMLVNTMAGRTFNDLTQYPVFPWILADYTSEELDLDDPKTFRNLSLPMGCQTAGRQAEFRDRYQSFAEMGDDNAPPFHYGTHYSSAMIVASYLIRLQPFVQSYLLLQGGTFDHADRLFYSIEKAWKSASRENMTDVRELIPEFFYLPAFLQNTNGYDFGVTQASGERIDTVSLPPWAKGDPQIFIAKHREALESPYVSRHLHQWIDLVFGVKQKGEAAVEATNVFHYLSYHGAKDLDNIEDPVERLATIGIIHNFGQTPHQVFPRVHPAREEVHHKAKRLDTSAASLTRLPFPTVETGERVISLSFSPKMERLLCATASRLNIPPAYEKYMEWGFADNSVRFYMTDSKKLAGLFEHLHQGQLSCALFADSRTLITAGVDCTISVWSVISTSKTVDLQPRTCLFGHDTPVMTLAISRSLSAILSASMDGQVFLWDLNRLEFVRKLCSGSSVECARISDVTGNIMLCRGRKVALFSLNGHLLLEQDVCDSEDDQIVSCAFYEGTGDEWLQHELLFTGHRRGVVNIWTKAIQDGAFTLELIRRLDHTDLGREDGSNNDSSITCILPMAQKVYTGDDDGRVYEWDCVQRHD